MSAGIIVHVEVGKEKRTEYFSSESVTFGSSEACSLQVLTSQIETLSPWFEIERTEDAYRISEFDKSLDIRINENPVRRFIVINEGDSITVGGTEIKFTFFSLASDSALITTNRPQTQVAPFIEDAALESATSPERDDAKMFLKEFMRELLQEISWRTKAITAVLLFAFLTALVYSIFTVSSELRRNREMSQQQSETIKNLEDKLVTAGEQLDKINESSEEFKKMISLAPTLRSEYGGGVCLIYGVYDLVDKSNGKVIRYPDGQSPQSPLAGTENETGSQPVITFTTSGTGAPVEYDFIGTGFHVGGGYIVSNRHVVQPWEEDPLVKQIIRDARGKPRLKKLIVFFPGMPQPLVLRVKQVSSSQDLSIGTVDPKMMPVDLPALPLDVESDAYAIGRTVISMGYPTGPDRLLAMLEDNESSNINSRCLGRRDCIIEVLSQRQKISPLLTQGSVTDLDSQRIVHDAKTSEGGSGSPVFGQTGKVIGVNFGVFVESNAANMAIPVKFAVEMLQRSGWAAPTPKASEVTTENPNAPVAR